MAGLSGVFSMAFDDSGRLVVRTRGERFDLDDRVLRIESDGTRNAVVSGLKFTRVIAIALDGAVLLLGDAPDSRGAVKNWLLAVESGGAVRVLATDLPHCLSLAADGDRGAYVGCFGTDDWHAMWRGSLPLSVPRGRILYVTRPGPGIAAHVETVVDRVNNPAGIALAPDGTLYHTADYHRIYAFDPPG
jgi:hypothetical protein